MLTLLQDVTADTVGDWQVSKGFQGMLIIDGGLGGGTITIEILGPKGNALTIKNQVETAINEFTAPAAIAQLSIPSGISVRASLSGATAPDVTVALF